MMGSTVLDDMAPETSKITYMVKAKIIRYGETDSKEVTLAEKSRAVRVIPASEELPPLSVNEEGNEYVLRKQKGLRKGFFRVRLGCLSMEAAQPKSLILPPPRSQLSEVPSTTATVVLRFDPINERAFPPRLGQLVSKLRVDTHFTSKPARSIPSKDTKIFDPHRGCYSESLLLSSRCMESARWHKGDSISPSRRVDSSTTIPSPPRSEPSSPNPIKPFYTTALLVPVTLPAGKGLVPTFHSCFVSRVYVLELSLTAYTSDSRLSAATLTLRLPLQIAAAGGLGLATADGSGAGAGVEVEVGDYFRPRTISPPADEYVRTSLLGAREG